MGAIVDLEKFILEDLSKERMISFINLAPDQNLLAEDLWKLILRSEKPISWRSSWFFEHLGKINKEVLRPYLPLILEELPKFKYDGQKRSCMIILQLFSLQDFDYGIALNISYDFFLSRSESLAVQVHAMQMIFNIAMIEPDLKQELREAIEYKLPEAQVGFKSRARRLLKKL